MKPIYTMPEQFMEDSSVPVLWRLYGMLNGFWVNGLTVYAANKYFSEKLKCSERTVRMSLELLEKKGLVRREVSGYKRTIYPGGAIKEDEGGSPTAGGEEAPLPPRRKPHFLPMHLSNATNKSSEVSLHVESSHDGEEKPPKKERVIPLPYSWENTRKVWRNSPQKYLQIISWYLSKKELWPSMTSEGKLSAVLIRCKKAAVRISDGDWTPKEVGDAYDRIEANTKMGSEWTLETVEKYLTK